MGLLSRFCSAEVVLNILNGKADINFGAIYENLAAQELASHDYKLYYFNSKRQGVLDFVIEHNGHALPIEIKSGKKTSRIGDAVYCFLFIVIFWFLSRWTTQGFNPLFLIISGLAVLAALYLIWNSTRSKFGPKESAAIAEVLNDSLSCTPR